MPKKRSYGVYNKPQSSTHPSLSAAVQPGSGNGSSEPSSVNDLISQSRRINVPRGIQQQANIEALTPTPTVKSIPFALPTRTSEPSEVYLTPRERMAARRRARGPPGPPAPPSWLNDLYTSRHATSPANHRFATPKTFDGPLPIVLLPDQHMPILNSFQDLILQAMASNWSWHIENDGEWLDVLPSYIKSALFLYLARAGRPVRSSEIRMLLNEVQSEELESWDSEPQAGITHFTIGPSVGRGLTWKQLSSLCHKPFATPDAVSSPASKVPESWDTSNSLLTTPPKMSASSTSTPTTSSPIPTSLCSPLHSITHLSLAHTASPSFQSLIVLLPHLSYLTHLSLTHWPTPTSDLTPALLATQARLPSNAHNALLTVRRLGRAAPRLTWLDLSGSDAWVKALNTDDSPEQFGATATNRTPPAPARARPVAAATVRREEAETIDEGDEEAAAALHKRRVETWGRALGALTTLRLGACGCGQGECAVPSIMQPYAPSSASLERFLAGLDIGQQQQHGEPHFETGDADIDDPLARWHALPRSLRANPRVRHLLHLRTQGLALERKIRRARLEAAAEGRGRDRGCRVEMEGAGMLEEGGGKEDTLGSGMGMGMGMGLGAWVKDVAEVWMRGGDIGVGWSAKEYNLFASPG